MRRKHAAWAFPLALLLTGCSASGPSDEAIRSCILDATDYEAVGVEKSNVVMGMGIGSSLIEAIAIHNVIKNSDGRWLVHSVLTIGARDSDSTDSDNVAVAQLLGLEIRNGFLLQDVPVDYVFAEGRHGWSCFEV
ncbi:hypothetical protein [Billgrantia aerodenitrificans]|uniref:Lipoprotein n=1 Tax=Billgrantia aerodenitrificans TaxID=2733483 RepID=A0ABS9AWE8_9GAMM|nr:hypothetical protein [Halomonas aerodenitrificans]MCE8025780.1 hypothetical protein [Halomonas aerodenitrificans]